VTLKRISRHELRHLKRYFARVVEMNGFKLTFS